MRKLIFSPIWSIILLGCFAWLFTVNPALIESLRLRYFDQLIVSQEKVENNIYAVNIDESAIGEYGQWPFPRGVYSDFIIDLYNRGAGLVVWNVLMSETDRGGGDEDLAITMSQVPIILTLLGTEENKNEAINPGASIINSDYMHLVPSVPGITANIQQLETNAVGSGIINTFPELDGVTRRAPLVFESNGILFPNVTLEVLRVLAGDPSFQIKLSPLGVDKLRIPQFGIIQTNEVGEVWLDWSQGYQSVSITDLPEDLGGAVVFVGVTAKGTVQPIATAAGAVYPHEIQATMLGTVFNESNISRHPDAKAWGELAALIVAGLLLITLAKWTYVGIAFFVLSVGGFIGVSIYVFNTQNILIDGATISAFLLLVGLQRYVLKFLDEFLQKQAIKKQFAGYASPEVVRILQENPSLVKDGIKKDVSIVFSDLRGFTPLGESFGDDVKGLTEIMNGYMDAITQPVLDSNGMIIKYIGDASMHIHNAPIDDPNHPKTAVQCGLDMLKAVEKFNVALQRHDRPAVGMGAGINTGLGYVGEMGSTTRHSYDILGDSVSTAARIESKCKEYGCLLLVGDATYQQTKDDFFWLKVDDLAVKGKSVGIGIWTVLDDVGPAWGAAQKKHEQMHEDYKAQRFDDAIAKCKLLYDHFDHKMRDYYDMWIERCEYMKTQDLPEDWNGVFIATTK
jgi:adenylate cyclase